MERANGKVEVEDVQSLESEGTLMRVLELAEVHSLVNLAYQGRVRLCALDGSLVELSDPENLGAQDGCARHRVRLELAMSSSMRQQYGESLPENLTAILSSVTHVQAGDPTLGNILISCPEWRDFVVRGITKVELVVPAEAQPTPVELLGAWAIRATSHEVERSTSGPTDH